MDSSKLLSKAVQFLKLFSLRDDLKPFCKIWKYCCFNSSEGSNKIQGETYKGTLHHSDLPKFATSWANAPKERHTTLYSKHVLNETGCGHNYLQLNLLLLLYSVPLQSTNPDQLPMGFQHRDVYPVNLNRIKCKLDCSPKI